MQHWVKKEAQRSSTRYGNAIGKLKEKYPTANKYYNIEVKTDEGCKNATEIKWIKKEIKSQSGVYFLRTSLYETPGIELALELKKQMEVYITEFGYLPQVIFLQNHGLIISSDNYEDIERLNEKIVIAAEAKAGIDFSCYRDTVKIANCYNEVFQGNDIAYFSEDATITKLLNQINAEHLKKPFSPDGYVFCGYTIMTMNEIHPSAFREYKEIYFDKPKIIRYNNRVYILAIDLKKAKMIEDVFKNNLLIANTLGTNLNFLEGSEISYLGNWEAEKYRQKL